MRSVGCPKSGQTVSHSNQLSIKAYWCYSSQPVLSLGNWSAMPTIRWVFLLLLFWRKSGCSETKVFILLTAQDLTSLPRPYRLHSYVLNTHHFPCVAKRHGLVTLLLLCSDISLNPGPISFGAVNYWGSKLLICKKQGTVHQ